MENQKVFDETGMQQLPRVLIFGCIGGLLSWAFSLGFLKHAPTFGQFLDPPLFGAFGAAAGAIFVFVIAQTDLRKRAFLLVLSLMAGFSFKPVLAASAAFIESQTQRAQRQKAEESISQVRSLLEKEKLTSEDKRALEARLGELSETFDELQRIDDRRMVMNAIAEENLPELIASRGSANAKALAMQTFELPKPTNQLFEPGSMVALESRVDEESGTKVAVFRVPDGFSCSDEARVNGRCPDQALPTIELRAYIDPEKYPQVQGLRNEG